MFVVGLTGGIGAGKSAVAHLFAAKNIPIIDTDVIARNLTAPGQEALAAIIKHFTPSILLAEGSLDRAFLRQIIFNDNQERLWLENLLHPLIKKEMKKSIALLKDAYPYCIAVIPLLFEVEFYSSIHRTLVIDTDEASQISRVMARDHLSKSQVLEILKAQANRKSRLLRADDVIVNKRDFAALEDEVDALHEKYLALSAEI